MALCNEPKADLEELQKSYDSEFPTNKMSEKGLF